MLLPIEGFLPFDHPIRKAGSSSPTIFPQASMDVWDKTDNLKKEKYGKVEQMKLRQLRTCTERKVLTGSI